MTTFRTSLVLSGGLLAILATGCTEQPKPGPVVSGPTVRPAATGSGPVHNGNRVPVGKTEADWLAAVRNADPKIRLMAVTDIKDFNPGPEKGVPVLVDLLRNDPDDKVRWSVPMALMVFGPNHRPATVTALSEAMLKDRHDWVRSHSALALASVAFDNAETAKPALGALIEALKDRAAQTNAALALNNLGRDASAAVPALLEALKDTGVRTGAMNALQRMTFGPDAAAGVPRLVECLTSTDRYVRRNAAELLGRIGPDARTAVPELVKALRDADADVAKSAAWALQRVDPEAAAAAGVS